MKNLFLICALSLLFISCSSKKIDASSYNKASMKHQQERATEAYKELN